MINIQKRYLISALVSGVSFIILYVFFDFYLWMALLLTILIYIAGIFLFKSQDIRIYDREALARYNFEMSKLNDLQLINTQEVSVVSKKYKDNENICNNTATIKAINNSLKKHWEDMGY